MSHTVYLCVGLPGSGKSTYSRTIELTSAFGDPVDQIVRINQDQLGSRGKCIMHMTWTMRDEKQVIVDRCNVTRQQRSFWIKLAKEHGYRVVVEMFTTPPEICLTRCFGRTDHETMNEPDRFKGIIWGMKREWEDPSFDEGIDQINVRDATGRIVTTMVPRTSKPTLWQVIKQWWRDL